MQKMPLTQAMIGKNWVWLKIFTKKNNLTCKVTFETMKTFVMEQMDIQMLFHIEQMRQTVWTIGWYWQNVEVNSDGQDINGLICKYLK